MSVAALRNGGRTALMMLVAVCAVLAVTFAASEKASAMDIKRVVSPGGIEAWLVEDHTRPLLAFDFAFRGGSAQDPVGKPGLAHFVSGMLDEGAGEISSQDFQEQLEENAIKLSFDAARDSFTGSMRTLSVNRELAFALTRLSITAPRMDTDAVERVREQIVAGIRIEAEDPEHVVAEAWLKTVFGDHPYGRPQKGTEPSVAGFTAEDLRGFVRRTFARDTLKIAVVGDITEAELASRLDAMFGALPAKAELTPVAEAPWSAQPGETNIAMAIPQSVVQFGMAGLKRLDPDFLAAYTLNYVLGGGGFASKLTEEVREKRGLAYSVYTYLYPMERAAVFLGGVATDNASVAQSISVIRGELARIAAEGLTQGELDNAKRYLVGSYALRFDSGTKISQALLATQIEGLGIDYIDKRNAMVEALTLDDMRRVAQRLIKPESLVVTVVGGPATAARPRADAAPAPAMAQ